MSELKSMVYGFAIGDALGVPHEFKRRGSFLCSDMDEYGMFDQPKGTWSDDTSMLITTCDSIRENRGQINVEDMRKKFQEWMFEGEYTPFGTAFGIGSTTRKALTSGKGLDDERSNGNGSLMRILPLAFVDEMIDESQHARTLQRETQQQPQLQPLLSESNEPISAEIINEISAITHAHETSKEACRIAIEIAQKLRKGIELGEILSNLNVSETYSRLRKLESLKEREIQSTGYVVHTMEASLWCLLHSNSYEEAVLKAVNLGDDTDTTAAVTGGFAGIIYGYENIQEKWIHELQNKELIEKCLFN